MTKKTELTIADIAREVGVTPKAARGKLRRLGRHKPGTKWPTYKRGTKEFESIVSSIKPSSK